MAMSRSLGGTSLTTRSPMRISPEVILSSPAIIRSKVDLPQPEGPTRTTNWPSWISTETPWITWLKPKALRTSLISTEAMPRAGERLRCPCAAQCKGCPMPKALTVGFRIRPPEAISERRAALDMSVVVPRHPVALSDPLEFHRRFQHHSLGKLADHGSLDL